MLTLPPCGTPVCVHIYMYMRGPYFCSMPYLEEVLWSFIIGEVWSAFRSSTARVQNTQVWEEAAVASWGLLTVVSLGINEICYSKRTLILSFCPSRQWYELILSGIDMQHFVTLYVFVHCKSTYSTLICSGGHRDGRHKREKRDNFNYMFPQAWHSAVAQPVQVCSDTLCSTRT